MNGWKRYIQKRVKRDKIDFATIACMLGIPASVKAPVLAATGGLAVAQLIAPCFQRISIQWDGHGRRAIARSTKLQTHCTDNVIETLSCWLEILHRLKCNLYIAIHCCTLYLCYQPNMVETIEIRATFGLSLSMILI